MFYLCLLVAGVGYVAQAPVLFELGATFTLLYVVSAMLGPWLIGGGLVVLGIAIVKTGIAPPEIAGGFIGLGLLWIAGKMFFRAET